MGLFGTIGNITGTIIGAGIGRKQQNEGDDMIKAAAELSGQYKRPEMKIPDAIARYLNFAQGGMYKRLPGALNYENQMQESTASAMTAVNSMSAGAEGLGAISNLYGNQQKAIGGLAGQEAQFRQSKEDDYMQALSGLGEWEQEAWQWNEADPYLQAQKKASELDLFGRMNRMSGYKTRAGAWAEGIKGAGESMDDNGMEDITKILALV